MNGSVIRKTQSIIQNLKSHFRLLAWRVEMDRAVLYALLYRFWRFGAGPVTALLISVKFTPTIQGFYFTFQSILALQTFAELGIGFAITQFASHEWANLKLNENKKIEGDPDSLSRLVSLAQIAIKWYSVAAIIIIVGLSIGGYVFFSQSPIQNVKWKLPWISLCVLTGFDFFFIAIWSLLEGCNQMSNVNFYRLIQGLCNSLATWSAILLGTNLWTASIMTLVGLLYAGFFIRRKYWEFIKILLLKKSVGPRLQWQADLFPFQWRIALSWVAGYLAYSLFVPILFHYHGPVVAGQMGMTWSLVSAVSSIGGAWMSPRAPQFGIMVAQKKFVEMDRLFWRLTIIVTGITILLAAVIWLFVFFLNYIDHFLSHRILSPLPTSLFLISAILQVASGPISTYLRAHKKEPLVVISVLFGCLVALSNLILGKYYSVTGMAMGYLTMNVMIFPVVILIWHRCRMKWHNSNE